MLKWILTLLFLCVTLSLYFVLQEGVRPKPIREINATSFSDLEQLGASIYRRLYLEMFESDVVVVGSSLQIKNFQRTWSGLLKTGAGYKKNFDIVITQPHLPQITTKLPIIEVKDYPSLVKEVLKAQQQGKKALVHVTNRESSHLFPKSYVSRLLKEPNLRVVSYTQGPFAITPQVAHLIEPNCKLPIPLSELSCRAISSGKRYWRKKLDESKTYGAVEKHGDRHHLVLIHQP